MDIIIQNKKKMLPIENITRGEVFIYEDAYFLSLEADCDEEKIEVVKAVDLTTYEVVCFSYGTAVTPVHSQLLIDYSIDVL